MQPLRVIPRQSGIIKPVIMRFSHNIAQRPAFCGTLPTHREQGFCPAGQNPKPAKKSHCHDSGLNRLNGANLRLISSSNNRIVMISDMNIFDGEPN
ncbi:MAG: hypothetical protein JJU15_13065 [Pararhodobacter sp.]|nr:hypothetical protein [Pararhodobacter sp.]